MPRTVLVVDTSSTERAALSGIVGKKYNAVAVSYGNEMISVLREKAKVISAIILDMVMSETDCFDALRKIRDNAIYRQIPVIVTSALSDEETHVQAMSLGASGYIVKPYNSDLLSYTLDNIIALREKSALTNTFRRDSLTGLLNRATFFETVDAQMKGKSAGQYIMSCFDIENFKVINDQYGMKTGDSVIKNIGEILGGCMDEIGGICCRDSADKFGMFFPAEYINSEILTSLHDRLSLSAFPEHWIKIRIGRYKIDDTSIPASTMYDRATLAEEAIKGRYDLYLSEYTDAMRISLMKEQKIVNDMNTALAEGEFEPWFQPQYNHDTGTLIGAEALARWKKDGKLISPAEFIPVFERNGFIYELDKYIWEQVCRLMRTWLDEGKKPLPVSVNVSRRDMFHTHFVRTFTNIVRRYELPFNLIRLEITETALADSSGRILSIVNDLVKLGFTVEIDDFGSGYSSLNTLKDVPATILKLDMRFFENSRNSQRGGNIIESVIRMAKWLDMAVIAEGVEIKEQADFLKSVGCYYIQGYYYAKPMPADDYEKLLDSCEKEEKMTRLKTLKNLDNNEFWSPKSLDSLIFNSYVGAACILEYSGGKVEMIRATESFTSMLESTTMGIADALKVKWSSHLAPESKQTFHDALQQSIRINEKVTGEYEFIGLPGCAEHTWLRSGIRVIATSGERNLIYCLSDNITAQKEAERKALAISEQINAVMDNSKCGIVAATVSKTGEVKFLFANKRFYKLIGYTREQYETELETSYENIHPEDRDYVARAVKSLQNVGQTATLRYRAICRDGRIVYILNDISIVKFDNISEPVQLNNLLDITEQVENDKDRLESVKKLETVMHNVGGGVSAMQIDENGKSNLIFKNKKFFELLGYTEKQAEEEKPDIMEMIHPDDFPDVMKKIRALKADGTSEIIDYRCRKRDGHLIYIRENSSLMELEGYGRVIVSVLVDITENVTLKDQLRAVIGNINGGVAAFYLDGDYSDFLFVNEQLFGIIGYTREQYRAEIKTLFDIIYPDDREKVEARFKNPGGQNEKYTIEFRIVWRDGAIRHIKCNANVIRLFGIDKPVQLAVINDVTEETVVTEQLRLINEAAHDILEEKNTDAAINKTLENMLRYFVGDRAYVIELDNEKQVINNTYERCASGIESEIELLQNVPFGVSKFWLDLLYEDKFVVIDNVEKLGDDKAELRSILLLQNINSIIVAPLWRAGKLIGFTGIDNPKRAAEQLKHLKALADYISLLITRRDLNLKLESDNRTMKLLMDDTPGAFVRMKLNSDGVFVPVYTNGGFAEMLGISPEKLHEIYGKNALDGVHPEDKEIVREAGEKMLACGEAESARFRVKNGAGEDAWLTMYGRVTKDSRGDTYLNIYYTDVTKELDEERRQKDLLTVSLSAMMSASEDLSYIKDADFRYICCSESCAKSMGRSTKDIIGKTDYEIFDKKTAQKFKIQAATVIESGKALLNIEEKVPVFDGEMRHVSTSIYPVNDKMGQTIGVYGVCRDITEQKAKESQLELINNNIPGGIAMFYFVGGKLRASYINDGLRRLSGYDRGEYKKSGNINPFDFVMDADRQEVDKQLSMLVHNGTQIDFNYRIRKKTGEVIWVNCKAIVSNRDGDTVYINAVLTDITEQQKDKERLRLAEEEYRIAARQSKQTIARYNILNKTLTITDEASVRLAIPKYYENIPYSQVEQGIISDDTADSYIAFYEKIIEGEKECSATFRKNLPNGWCWLSACAITLKDENGTPVSAIISFTDVTEQQEKEAVYIKWLHNLQDIGKSGYTLYRCNLNKNNTYDKAEGDLLGFRTEADSTKTFNERVLDFAHQCVCEEDRKKYIDFVNSDKMLASYYRGKRADKLEFRGITKNGDVRWVKLSIELVEYPNTTEVAAYLMYEDINESKTRAIQVKLQAETDPLTGLYNRKTFETLVGQKISEGKENTVSALYLMDMDGFKLVNDLLGHSEGDSVLIEAGNIIRSVIRETDLACRMGGDEFLVYLCDMQDEAAVLKKAKQLCLSMQKSLDMGVKISISLGIAVFPGDGTAFETLFRKADKALYYVKEHGKNNCALYSGGMSNPEGERKTSGDEQIRRKILIVDDVEANRIMLENIFSDEYEIVTAESGQEALIYLRRNALDVSVMLLDLMMPGMDGFTVLEKMKNDAAMQMIPVIIVSGADDRETNLKSIRAGASDFVMKPVDSELLRIRVESAISKAENERLKILNRALSARKNNNGNGD